jgi:hypothetical protein
MYHWQRNVIGTTRGCTIGSGMLPERMEEVPGKGMLPEVLEDVPLAAECYRNY